ncbi:hypothetical protein ACFO25_16415 [Paenactinomyces guangxiensis]|uniref:Uncharacterized protein n=1 Tax=Paenactinomyces guangxiensis TaxID=1490290 RepID=A0A7W1WTU2_9BACL|nr:hypothetical protein [Paenactinomyces guangxiensis]MBA4495924.1 hypothetical protein [Paenactinomyces guangxiensis]MBH8592939.1 hypothetical protein [Paenactinomyces guangxiensis]
MGQIIDLEQIRTVRRDRIRNEALKRFPWREMERISRDVLEPMVRFWSEKKRHILLELVYRSVYEAFVYGMLEAKNARGHLRDLSDSHTWDDIYRLFYQENCQQLMQQMVNQFAIFQWLDEWRCESVCLLLEYLIRVWFIEGLQFSDKS